MKMQCDVCQKAGASVFCAADEAALCDVCDHSVHHANKLAGKHHRFSLLVPSPDQIPLCDICQEKRAFLFCQQDRAILCRNCDASIHKSNEHTQKHNRFLLTGIKLSVDSELFVPPPPPPSIANGSDNPPIRKSKPQRPTAITNNPPAPPPVPVAIPHHPHNIISNSKATAMGDRSSMSEYLIEMLPGWPVENLLDSSSPSDDFCKTIEPLWDHDIIGIQNQNPFLSYEKTEICVPPYTPQQQQQQQQQTATMAVGMKNQKEGKQKKSMAGKKRDESFFIVPEIISQPNSGFKRYRTNLW